ncbi:putative sugar transporter sugar binding protein [Frankia sp. AgKG'84/4]
MRKRRALPMAVALGMILLASCSGGGSGHPAGDLRPTARPATAGVDDVAGATASPACAAQVRQLRVAAVSTLDGVMKAAKADLEKAHPGLTVDITQTAPDYTTLVQRISADRLTGRSVDVAVAGFDQLPAYANQLGAQQLSPRLLRASYDQRLLGLGTVGGRLVGIPQQVASLALVYNLDVLQRAGVDPATLTTTDGVIAAADKIRASGQNVQPIDLPTGQLFGQWILNTLASSQGTPIQDAAGRPALTTPAARAAAAFLAKVGTYGPQSDNPAQQGLLRFGVRRQTAMTVVSVASLAGSLTFIAGQGAKGFRAGAVPFPTLPGGSQHPVAVGNALTVLATDRCQREMATELIVSLLSPDVVAASTEASSYLPVDTEAINRLGSFYDMYPQLKPFLALSGSLVKAPAWGGARGGEVASALTGQVVRIVRGEDPDRTLTAAQAQAAELTR